MTGLFYQVQDLNQFLDLTQVVSDFSSRPQLQKIRTYKWGELWGLGLEFHPEPGLLLLACNSEGRVGAFRGKPAGIPPASHPLSLYLKAHFGNARVESARLSPLGAWDLAFSKPGLRLLLEARDRALVVVLEVEGRKPYRQELRLASLGGAEASAPPATPPEARASSAEDKKRAKLLENIRGDIREAEEWLTRWTPVLARLEGDPAAWKRVAAWPEAERELVEEAVRREELPPPSGENVKSALATLFARKRKSERKIEGGRKRLARVESTPASVDRAKLPKGAVAAVPVLPVAPRKKPGVWVELKVGVWARVGRSASENDELFRQARDRDLWFHVRGGAGSHVWIPRGQPGFGAKSDPPEDLVRMGCQLALINSKSAASGRAVVDYTERRSLRRIRSAEGMVEILRSETRQVRLDEAFERRVMRKGDG